MRLTLAVLFVGIAGVCGASASELPKGWRLPSDAELSDAWRHGEARNAVAKGDFNGDGAPDVACLAVRTDGMQQGLLAFVSDSSETGRWHVLDRFELSGSVFMGLDLVRPGKVEVCAPDGCDGPKTSLVIWHDAFRYYRPESAASIYVFASTGEFERHWESD